MMKHIFIIISILFALGFTACGYKEGVKTGDAKAYVYFTGDVSNAKVTIDNGPSFSVEAGKDNIYKINPGKHLIEIYKNGVLRVKREIFVSDGVSKEIGVN